ncbi:unnamed protein product [Fraxinus pennsylvanica]|uniref:TLC domain-containing protein n=1 Tax=Fraxinus pennsylvanica TaxID=56036 RepID=A0AAD2AH99_9LAMI|nr:unnamed protein product [Fraxinus pennsylvanica]
MVFQVFLNSIDWEHESYTEYKDLIALPIFAIFFPTVRFFLDRFVFEKLGRRIIFGKGMQVVENETAERRKKIRKFKESAWKFVYFLSAEILALLVTYNEPWFTNTKYFWVGPGNQVWPDQKYKLKLKGQYMYDGGFYTYSIFALIFWETRRSDFWASMGHHVATFILIVLSYKFRFARVGSVVLALHDASDVFLEVGKMSKYGGAETLASFSFVLFVLSWVLLRLIYYPFWVLWSTSYEVILTLDKEKHRLEAASVTMFDPILRMKISMKIDHKSRFSSLLHSLDNERTTRTNIQCRRLPWPSETNHHCRNGCRTGIKKRWMTCKSFHPSLLIVAMSSPSLHFLHHLSSKTLIGSLILPEFPFSGNSVEPSLGDNSCNIYALNHSDKLIMIALVQYSVTAERSHAVAKLLIGEQIIPERVLILDSVQSRNFRGKLSPDDVFAVKLETSLERRSSDTGYSPLIKGLDYFPSGSVVEGLAAALLSQCQLKKIKGTLFVSWPHFGVSVISLIKSLLLRDVFTGISTSSDVDLENEYLRFTRSKDRLDSELYT